MKLRGLVLALVLLVSLGTAAQTAPPQALLALAKKDSTLALVDPASLRVIARIPAGPDPHEVIASTDGRRAYVSNYGFGQYDTISVVDLAAQKALPAIDLGPLHGPHGLTFAGGKLWFTAEGAKAIGSYDPASRKVDWIMGTGQNRTHMIYVFPDLQRIITTNVSSGTVSFIDHAGSGRGMSLRVPGGDWNETVVPVGNGDEGFDVSPDGREIWVANAQDGTVSILDVSSRKVIQTLTANVPGANRLKFTTDGKLVFISSLRLPEVAVFDAASRKEVKRIRVGQAAAGILMQPDGSRVFVACSPDNYIAVIDRASLTVTGHIDVGHEPDGMAWAER